MTNKCMELDETLDEESWNWLGDNHPKIAVSLEIAVQRGATPTEIRGRVLERVGPHRLEFATRCESAARHLMAKQ